LPATLEAVIDGSVKTGLDLTPVQAWMELALNRIVKHGQQFPSRAIPKTLGNRLPEWLAKKAVMADSHWLDTLAAAMERHREQYWAEVEALALEACPPVELFEHGRDWLHVGKELRQAYSRVIRQTLNANDEAVMDDASVALNTGFDAARNASEAFLKQWPADKQNDLLIGAAAYLYMLGPQKGNPVRDTLIWQLGRKRENGNGRVPGIAQMMLSALRQIGLMGEPVWTTTGAVLHYRETSTGSVGVPVRISGVWFNFLRATQPDTPERMSLVPRPQREQAKARIADYVQDKFRDMLLTTEITDNNRVITRTPHGNLFGYVQRDHELAAIRHDQWRIAWAHVIDGNIQAILQPISNPDKGTEPENGANRLVKAGLLGLVA
jgi:hypothetical protein